MSRRLTFALASLLGVLTLTAAALAQTGPYGGEGGDVQEQVTARGGGVLGELPFTGLDLALIAGAGLLLLVVGITLRRVNRRQA